MLHFQAYDQHLNMILSEVEETITTVEIDEETYEELFKVQRMFCLFRLKLPTVFLLSQVHPGQLPFFLPAER